MSCCILKIFILWHDNDKIEVCFQCFDSIFGRVEVFANSLYIFRTADYHLDKWKIEFHLFYSIPCKTFISFDSRTEFKYAKEASF